MFDLLSLTKGYVTVSSGDEQSKYEPQPGVRQPISVDVSKEHPRISFKTNIKAKSPNPEDKRKLAFAISNVILSE